MFSLLDALLLFVVIYMVNSCVVLFPPLPSPKVHSSLTLHSTTFPSSSVSEETRQIPTTSLWVTMSTEDTIQ